jgi:hypothetical protein
MDENEERRKESCDPPPEDEYEGEDYTPVPVPFKYPEVNDEVAAAPAEAKFNAPIAPLKPEHYYVPSSVVKLCASLLSRFTTKDSPDEFFKRELPRVQVNTYDTILSKIEIRSVIL